ncbi:hypothetical protein FO519_005167 [Halicephalobus sp. NKZ332]|nr:hypothetical protein FO519_005167 [Halicephalobus sp. NKZ332]
MSRNSNPFQCFKVKKSVKHSFQDNELGKLMEFIDLPYSGVVEPDFRPVFTKANGAHMECCLHYYDPEERDDLSVLVALSPFGWKKMRCSKTEDAGHHVAHFLLPKDFVEPFQFKFIVNNEYILCPTGGKKEYQTITTEDGFENNIVDPKKEFQVVDSVHDGEKEEKMKEVTEKHKDKDPQSPSARSVFKFLLFPKKPASPLAGEKKKGFNLRLPSLRKTRNAPEEAEKEVSKESGN